MNTTLSLLVLLLLVLYFVVWQGYRLRGRRAGIGQAGLVLAIAGTLGHIGTGRLHRAHLLEILSVHDSNLIRDLFLVLGCVGALLFKLAVSTEDVSIRSRAVLRIVGPAVMIALALLVIATVWTGPRENLSFGHSFNAVGVAVYHIVANSYEIVVLVICGRWLWTYAGTEQPRTRTGLRIAAFGVCGMAALTTCRTAPVVLYALGGPGHRVPSLYITGGTSILLPVQFIGLSYPILAARIDAFRSRRDQRATYRRLGPTWWACTTIYPAIVLRPRSPLRSSLDRAGHLGWRQEMLTRRRNECFDGLTQFLAGTPHDRSATATAAAAELRDAVHRYDDSRPDTVSAVLQTRSTTGPVPSTDTGTAMLITIGEMLGKPVRESA